MARMKKKEMSKHFTIVFLLFQNICQICHSLEIVESYSQAFIQTDKHLTYVVDEISSGIPIEVKAGQGFNDLLGTEELLLPSAIQLDPPMLDFQERPVGMPHMELVTVYNTDGKNNLHLLSISGSTAHFHCSFFQDKIVPPGGNTTFDVVFLARQEGNVENTLYIHTSLGSFKYQVFGVGIANPYRLRPYLGAKVPVNSSFASFINIHNPHSTTLQVLEMFSSEGDLHLELPTGEKEAPRSLWEIPPYETKTIMKAHFVGRTENNHTAFIRIKTDHKTDKQLLVLPMEVEVTSLPGIYVTAELIDFGIVRTFDEPKTVPINLINTGNTPVQISSIIVTPPNEAITIDFQPIKLLPELLRQTTVAMITFRASKAIHPKQWCGTIIIRSKNNEHKISVPFEAKVLHGSVTYHKNMTYFFAHNHPTNYSRLMTFTNTFNFSLVLYNVTLPSEVRDVFSILNFSRPVILSPQILITPFILKFHPKVAKMHFRTVLSLHTNASRFDIELIVYNGQLKIIPLRPEKFEGHLDFGTVGVKEKRSVLFTLVNDNPIELIIWPYHFAVFSLNLVAPEEEGHYQAEVIISTPFQDTFMPVKVRTSEGSLHAIPERVVFDRVFPGKVPMKVLQVHSTFQDYMELKSVTFQPPDPRFYFIYQRDDQEHLTGNKYPILVPQTNNTIGRIYYDFKKECQEDCYVGLPTHTPAGHRWLQGLSLDRVTSETDEYLFNHFRRRWNKLQEEGKDRVNVTIEIDTSTVQGFLFSAHVHHHWPDVIRKFRPHIRFPLTQIGNYSTVDVLLENTGDIPILVQVLPLHLYPTPVTIVELLKKKLPSHFSEYMETDDKDIFKLSSLDSANPKSVSEINRVKRYVEALDIMPHPHTITTMLHRADKIKVQIEFLPKDDILKTSLLIVRNNLTIIDAIVLEGQGGRGEMKLNNKKPGASPLQFDINEKLLKNCEKKSSNKNVPNFTVKRSFTLKNSGELPFYIHSYYINNSPCEGFGFRVLDCDGVEMLPNTSRKLDIAFTPDFTMSRIQRTLTIHTSLGGAFNYTLQATVPPHTLSKCAASLPRPNWEPVVYYCIVCIMGFILFCIMVASYFEADRLFVADILKRKVKMNNGTPPYQKDQIFDLRNIGISNDTPCPVSARDSPANIQNRIPPPANRPIIQMSNGDIGHEHKEKDSIATSLWNIIKSILVSKQNSAHKKVDNNNIESPLTVAKNVQEHQTTSSANIDKDKVNIFQDADSSEKANSIYTQQKPMLRKSKAVKSSNTDISPTVESHNLSGISVRKLSNKSNTPTNDKKFTETCNTVKDATQTLNVTNTDSSGLASFDDTSCDSKPTKGKKKVRSKPDREKPLVQQPHMDDKEDETSSTTTESSNGGDVEEKTGNKTSVAEPPPPPKPKKKNRGCNLEPLVIPQPEDDAHDFELTSKFRAYKKVRGQKDLYAGGDTMKTCSFEIDLPYDIEKAKKKKKKIIPQKFNEKLSVPKGFVSDLDLLADFTMDAYHSERDSPPPTWDEPLAVSTSEDLSELSIQTDQFAQRQARILETAALHPHNILPDTLTSSSRSSSYSSIVSSSPGNTEGANGKIKVDKRYPLGFTPFSETKASVTPKTSPTLSVGNKKNAWGIVPNSSPTTAETIRGYGLLPTQAAIRTSTTLTESHTGIFNQSVFSYGLGTTSSTDSIYGSQSAMGSPDASMTMMQRLQQERRRRIQEYRNRHQNGEDWPGFDVPPTRNESLWDSEYNIMENNNAWATTLDNPTTTDNTGLWSMPTNSTSSSWNSLMGIWGGASTTPLIDTVSPSARGYTTPEGGGIILGSPLTNASPDALPSFNPFMSDIWSPTASLAPSRWNLPTNLPGNNNGEEKLN